MGNLFCIFALPECCKSDDITIEVTINNKTIDSLQISMYYIYNVNFRMR